MTENNLLKIILFITSFILLIIMVVVLWSDESQYIFFKLAAVGLIFTYITLVGFYFLGFKQAEAHEISYDKVKLKGHVILFLVAFITPLIAYSIYALITNDIDVYKLRNSLSNSILIDSSTLKPKSLMYGEKEILSDDKVREFNFDSESRNLNVDVVNDEKIKISDATDTYEYGVFNIQQLKDIGITNQVSLNLKELYFEHNYTPRLSNEKRYFDFEDPELPFYIVIYDYTDYRTVFDIYDRASGQRIKKAATIFDRGSHSFRHPDTGRFFIILVVEANHETINPDIGYLYSRFSLLEIEDTNSSNIMLDISN